MNASIPADKLSLLILGGTGFIGPHTIHAALERGHSITLFHRGQTNPGLYPDLETLHGDRDGALDALAGRRWDVVIDNCGYLPRLVRASTEFLTHQVSHYVFISSISVYADPSIVGLTEESALGRLQNESVEVIDGKTYGPLKALCEESVTEIMGGRCTILRPGLIVGPRDKTDRFTYWPVRASRGGEILAPNTPEDPIQIIDARDLAAFIILCAEQRLAGRYNVISPTGELTIGGLLKSCLRVSGQDAVLTWLPAAYLAQRGIEAWTDMPVWEAPLGDSAGMGRVDTARALEAGLRIRNLDDTVKATLAWWNSLPRERTEAALLAGISAEQEARLLAEWHERATL
jgi:2'-hydroxyisoflavone reductase